MKFFFLLILFTLPLFQNSLSAQGMLKRLKQKVQDKVSQKADDAVDKSISQPGESAGAAKSETASAENTHGTAYQTAAPDREQVAAYRNYDFVPGDKIIFQSDLATERVGEIPSQFVLTKGQADVQEEDGEQVIHIPKGPFTVFTPRFSSKTNIPDAFTIEFDYKDEAYGVNHINVDFGFTVGTYGPADVMPGIAFNSDFASWTLGNVSYPDELLNAVKLPMQWHHIAIAVNRNAGKAYIDQYRVASVNNLAGKHEPIAIEVIAYDNAYLKNIRIAAGGIDVYKKITTDSKIVTHGILFDLNEATLQPASMGTINSIYRLLTKNPAWQFEIDGHTDNTGSAARNLTLSQARADAVKTQLVGMGIDASRLTAKGFGDTKPLGGNSTPEEKANNRRVEFIKK